MIIECGSINTEAQKLRTLFKKCYNLTSLDMRNVIDLIESVYLCSSTSVDQGLQSVLDTDNYAEYDDGNSFAYFLLGDPNDKSSWIRSGDETKFSHLNIFKNSVAITGANSNLDDSGTFQVYQSKPSISYILNATTVPRNTTVSFNAPIANTFLNFPAKAAGTYTIATLNDIPTVDGSETKINIGNRMTKSGSGTIDSPYLINSIPPTLISGDTTTLSGDGFTTPYKVETKNLQKAITGDYTLLASDDLYSIKVNNGSTPVTITVPLGLPENFFCGFTQKGTGDVTFVGSVGASITNPIGLKIKGQGYAVGLEQIGSSNTYDLLADTKA